MADNKLLSKAKDAKKDEFYTQLTDIEKEMKHYKDFFNINKQGGKYGKRYLIRS